MPDSNNDPLDKLPATLEERVEHFRSRMRRFHDYSLRAHRIYFWLNSAVVLAGLIVAPAITIVALSHHSLAAAILGGVMTVLLGIQAAFKLGEHSRHWESMHNRAKIARGRLEGATVRDENLLASMIQSWEELRIDFLEGLPAPAKLEDKQS
jgi:hypothetical protein